MDKLLPVYATRRRGFSLVLSLTVMAMLLLLCISIAALMAIELRVGRTQIARARARMNALVGARIALGELQRLAGPDQRVTATGDILCSQQDKASPSDSSYYNDPSGVAVIHPRWVGVWNSGRQAGATSISGVRENGTVWGRHNDGYLVDTRFYQGGDWAKDRLTSPRMIGWLVSGNEAITRETAANDYFTPATPITQADSMKRVADFPMVGTGVIRNAAWVNQPSASDMLGLRVRRVAIPDSEGRPVGSFAYAVLDEGVKGRINLSNKYAGLVPEPGSPASGGYFNLVLPQRPLFDNAKASYGAGRAESILSTHSAWDSTKVSALTDFTSIPLLAVGSVEEDVNDLRSRFYHDISFHSAGVAADVSHGGLRKDLWRYMEKGEVADASGVADSGISDATPLMDTGAATPSSFSPKLGLLRNWYSRAPDTAHQVSVSAPAVTGLVVGTNTQTPAYASVATNPVISPVLAGYNFSYTIAVDGTTPPTQKARYLKYVHFTLWNPYAVSIQAKDLTLTVNSRVNANCNLYGGGIIYSAPRRDISFRIPGDTVSRPGRRSPSSLLRIRTLIPRPSPRPRP